jgi:hypothetical protein
MHETLLPRWDRWWLSTECWPIASSEDSGEVSLIIADQEFPLQSPVQCLNNTWVGNRVGSSPYIVLHAAVAAEGWQPVDDFSE